MIASIHLVSATDPQAGPALHTLNGQLAAYYNCAAIGEYHQIAETVNKVWSRPSYHMLVRELVRPGMTVLDMGCGSGHAFANLKDRGARYTGIDWSRARVAENAKVYGTGPSFLAGSLYNTKLATNSYDVCFSLYVLEHLVWPHLFLREMVRLTRPGGWLMVLCPDFRSLGRIPSLRYGKVVAPLRDKMRRGLLIDGAQHLFLRTVYYPRVIRRRYPRERFPFLINLEPSCLGGAYYADNDAVYFVDREEVSAELARLGAEDRTARLCAEYGFPWPVPRGLTLVMARKATGGMEGRCAY